MMELDAETLHRLCRERAPKTVDRRTVSSKRCVDERRMLDELSASLPEQVATREGVIHEIYEERNMSYPESADVVSYAIELGLIVTADDGNLIYIPKNRGDR